MYSRVRWIGLPYDTPCQPSTTCGPDGPIPRMKRPPDSASIVIAVIAVMAGVRPGICMIPVPSRIFLVSAPIHDSGVIASEPYASAVHTESKPTRSASRIVSIGKPICAPE